MIIPDAMKGKNTWVRLFSARNMSPQQLGPGQGAIPSGCWGAAPSRKGGGEWERRNHLVPEPTHI